MNNHSLPELQRKHEWAERMRRNAIIALESAVKLAIIVTEKRRDLRG